MPIAGGTSQWRPSLSRVPGHGHRSGRRFVGVSTRQGRSKPAVSRRGLCAVDRAFAGWSCRSMMALNIDPEELPAFVHSRRRARNRACIDSRRLSCARRRPWMLVGTYEPREYRCRRKLGPGISHALCPRSRQDFRQSDAPSSISAFGQSRIKTSSRPFSFPRTETAGRTASAVFATGSASGDGGLQSGRWGGTCAG